MNVIVCLHAGAAGAPLGRADRLALDQALSLAAREPGHQVTAVLVGTDTQTEALEGALAAGAHRAVRIDGEDVTNADFHSFGQIFAAAIKRLGADLVLAGMAPDHGGLAAVPAAMARHLGFVHVSGIEAMASAPPQGDGGSAVDVTVRGGGRKRRLRITLPAVLSVAGAAEGGSARVAGTGTGREVEVLSLVDPERTVVRRRAELNGKPEAGSRSPETVTSAAAFVAALYRK